LFHSVANIPETYLPRATTKITNQMPYID